MKLKKVLASVLALCMVMSTMSFNVFAKETTAVAKVGDTYYDTLAEAMGKFNSRTVEVLCDVEEDIDGFWGVTLVTNVEGGVTITDTNTENWIDFDDVTVGAGVTVEINLPFSGDSENVILGTLAAGETYYHGYDAKTTIKDGGKVTVSGTTILRYNETADAGLYIYGDGDDSTVEFDCDYYIGAYSGTFYAENANIEAGYYLLKNSYDNETYADVDLTLDNSSIEVVGTTDGQDSFIIDDKASVTLKNGSAIKDVRDFNILAGTDLTLDIDSESSIEATNISVAKDVPVETVDNGDGTFGVKTVIPVEVETYEELVAALAKDKSVVVMKNDITETAAQNSGYGVAGIVVDAGDVLDGDGHKLTITGANTTWDCAVAMKGGAVKNLTIAGAMRGVFMPGANGDVVIDNCKFKDVIYTFNSDGGNKNYKVTIKNTVLNGWTSFSDVHGSVTFENCEFGEGSGYAFCRPYQATTFNGCDFEKGYKLDTSIPADNSLVFTECKYDGEPISAENGIEMFYNKGNIIIDSEEAKFVSSPVASVGLATFATLKEAVAAAKDGDTIYVTGTVNAETVKLPAKIKDLTIAGATESAMLKDSTIMAADGNSIDYDGLTIKNLTFDNSRISLTGWRNNGASIKNLVVENNTFKNLDDTTSSAPMHINMAETEAVDGFTFTNNIIDGATGGSKSGIYAQVTGNAVVKNNVINNVACRPFVIQLTTDDGIDDSFIVEGNTFSNNASGRLQGLGNNAAGTDSVNLVITNNIIHNVPDAQEICYWNFNPETTTATFSYNYFGADIIANPSQIYFNSSAADVDALINMGIFPFYEELNEDGTINTDSLNNGEKLAKAMIGNSPYTSIQKAVDAAEAGDIITVQDDITEKVVIAVPAAAYSMRSSASGITIDLNNFTLTGNITVNSGATATIKNGTIINDDSSVSAVQTFGTTTLENVDVTSARHAVRVEGGVTTINGGNFALIQKDVLTQNVIGAENAVVIINDGVFTGPAGTTADSGAAVAAKTGSTVEIYGGKFSGGKNNTLSATGTLVVNGGMFDQDPAAYIAETSEAIDRGAYEYPYGVAPKAAAKINVALKATDNKNVYNIVITSADEYDINEFVSAELTFKNESVTVGGSVMDYKISGYADNKTFAQEAKDAVGLKDNEEQYIISLNDGAKRLSSTDAKDGDGIIIGQVEFIGQGDIKFSVTKGEVDTTWQNTNLGRYYTTEIVAPSTEATLGIENASINSNVPEVHRDVAVNVAFNHNIDTEKYWGNYQITATIKNSAMNYTEPKDITIKDIKSGACVFEDVPVGYITVTLKAPGFRTYTYNTTLEETKDNGVLVLNFWNDVKKGNDEAIEKGKDKMAHNFLVGDIVMDMKVDKYDLAAVTSYYGTYGIDKAEAEKYIKYDLNRDGDIDIRDVQYVLHTMGN